MVPVKGYATGAPLVFGIGEEIIWPFLASLLGLQATYEISSYNDLVIYNNEIYDSFSESLSGLAGQDVINKWILNAVQGLIETDSIVWQKFREWAISNYTVASADSAVIDSTINNVALDFTYYINPTFKTWQSSVGGRYYSWNPDYGTRLSSNTMLCCSDTNKPLYRYEHKADGTVQYTINMGYGNTYTFDNKTVYYYQGTGGGASSEYEVQNISSANYGIAAWAMVYGDAIFSSENVGVYSDAFDNVITLSEKEDIINGTSVIQLYNPADYQNGLHFVPDPEEPDDIKIPFAITADWWNFLQQNGNGENSNQYVNAYYRSFGL